MSFNNVEDIFVKFSGELKIMIHAHVCLDLLAYYYSKVHMYPPPLSTSTCRHAQQIIQTNITNIRCWDLPAGQTRKVNICESAAPAWCRPPWCLPPMLLAGTRPARSLLHLDHTQQWHNQHTKTGQSKTNETVWVSRVSVTAHTFG